MAAAAILKIQVNDHNSVAIAYIYTKFGSERKTDVLETEVPSNFTYLKTKMAAGRHFKNTNRHNSAALQDIFTSGGNSVSRVARLLG